MIYRIYIFENILKLQNLKICLVETANFRDYWLELTMNNKIPRSDFEPKTTMSHFITNRLTPTPLRYYNGKIKIKLL